MPTNANFRRAIFGVIFAGVEFCSFKYLLFWKIFVSGKKAFGILILK